MLFNSAISKYILSYVFQFFCSACFCSTIDVPSPSKTTLDFFEVALNVSEDEHDRKTAAIKCLEKLSEDRNIIKNVTKHVLKHMVTAAELKAPERPNVPAQLTLISISAQSIDNAPTNPPKNVIVSPLVTVGSPDSDNPHGGILHTPIKVKATINTDPSINKVPGFTSEGTTYIINRTTDDLNKPYLATCFFGR